MIFDKNIRRFSAFDMDAIEDTFDAQCADRDLLCDLKKEFVNAKP